MLSAIMNATLADMMSDAPRKSSLCFCSWRGSRLSSVSTRNSAMIPIGMLIQKITFQWKYSARNPPNAGPHAPAVV